MSASEKICSSEVRDRKVFTFFLQYHLWSLDALISVSRAHLFQQATLVLLDRPGADSMTEAKRDLHIGEHLDDIGSFTFHIIIEHADIARELDVFPVGLAPMRRSTDG